MTTTLTSLYRLHTGTRWMLGQAVRRDQETVAGDTNGDIGRAGCRRTIKGNYMIIPVPLIAGEMGSHRLELEGLRAFAKVTAHIRRDHQTLLSRRFLSFLNPRGVVSTSGGKRKSECI